jgi:putative membrane protein
MIKLLSKWALSACALMLVAHVTTGVSVNSFTAALLAAFVIGLLNTVVKPILVVLTLPVTLITLGLFYFVLNALMFWAAGRMLDGFEVRGFMPALLGSLVYSLCQLAIEAALDSLFKKKT